MVSVEVIKSAIVDREEDMKRRFIISSILVIPLFLLSITSDLYPAILKIFYH